MNVKRFLSKLLDALGLSWRNRTLVDVGNVIDLYGRCVNLDWRIDSLVLFVKRDYHDGKAVCEFEARDGGGETMYVARGDSAELAAEQLCEDIAAGLEWSDLVDLGREGG